MEAKSGGSRRGDHLKEKDMDLYFQGSFGTEHVPLSPYISSCVHGMVEEGHAELAIL